MVSSYSEGKFPVAELGISYECPLQECPVERLLGTISCLFIRKDNKLPNILE
jgi:hypothetical protein